MDLTELELYASELMDRLITGDRTAYVRFAELLALVFLNRMGLGLSAPDAVRVTKRAQVEIMLAASRLSARPDPVLGWIEERMVDVQRRWAEWVTFDRSIAEDLQKRMLPPALIEVHGMQLAFGVRPFDALSGDFFDCYPGDDDVVVAMGDVMGKGTAAALLASLVIGKLRVLTQSVRDPGQVLTEVNSLLMRRKTGAEYTTLIVARWRPQERELTVSNGGNVLPQLIRDGAIDRINSRSRPLGLFETSRYDSERVQVRRGDVVLMTSDGLTEQPTGTGSDYRLDDAARILPLQKLDSAEAILKALWTSFDESTGRQPAVDDQTLVVMRFP